MCLIEVSTRLYLDPSFTQQDRNVWNRRPTSGLKSSKFLEYAHMLKAFLNEKLIKVSKHPKVLCWDEPIEYVRLFSNLHLLFLRFSKNSI